VKRKTINRSIVNKFQGVRIKVKIEKKIGRKMIFSDKIKNDDKE